MSKRIGLLFTIGLVLSVVLVACGPMESVETKPTEHPATAVPTDEPDPKPEPIVLEDDRGFEVILDKHARKIISITPSMTEILYGVGAGEYLIGRDSNSTSPEAALGAVDLGGMWDGIPVEDILALEPDLILMGEIYSEEQVNELRDLGLTVYWQANPDDFEGLFENISDIAVLTGMEDAGDELISSLSARVAALDEKLAAVGEIPLIFYELDASEPANPWTAGGGTFISHVITRAQATNLGDRLEGDWVQISSEEIVAQNPDVILLADAPYGVTPESIAERAGWDEIKAVVDGAVYPFDPYILSVPGPRLVDGFELLAEILHPEITE